MRKLLLIVIVLNSFLSSASHIVGGDIYYDYLGNNQYRFYITLYRDCFSTGAQYDDPLPLGVFYTNSMTSYQQVSVPFPGSNILPIEFNNPCATAPTNVCVEKAVYTIVLNLPPTPGGYTIAYQRCCRGPNVTNLIQPENTGITLVATIPGSETSNWQNSSPRFTNYPPIVICNTEELIFDHVATDPDGDQLVYSLVTPYAGANDLNPAPNPIPPLPYFPVGWAGGYSATNPMGGGSSVTINSSTGLLNVQPNMLGLFVVGVMVEEYRNGVLISRVIRDFLFKVFDCNITMQAILPDQEELPTFISYCQGLTVQFENNSYGGTSYQWDFGVAGMTSDVSTQFEPTYTYPTPGDYTATLIVNPGMPCTDTAYMDITVNNVFNVSYTVADSICFTGNSLDFLGQTDGPAGSAFVWDFGPNSTIQSATSLSVNDVSFNASGFIPVTLYGSNADCEAEFTDSIFLFPEPIASIELPTGFECEGLTIPFGNNSINTVNYQWDFGVAGTTTDESDEFEPTFTFPQGGVYSIQLIAGSTATCFDTTEVDIEVNELLTVSFTHNDSLCITGNSFNFDATVTGPSDVVYQWNFGQVANPSTSNDLDVNNVVYNNFGSYPVTLTASFDNCSESYSSTVFIFREPEIDFRVEPGPRCAPALVQFTDLSLSDSPLTYTWNFGDGGTSTLQNPSHVYSDPGNYNVSLGIISSEGCIDTLYLMYQDLVTIHPSPVSSFIVDPVSTDICHAEITFTDQSIDAASIFYWYDDSTHFIDGAEAIHVYNYVTSGWHNPIQIVTNQFGCKDTSMAELYIEPFIIYIPNTFTPDGDEFNNDFLAKYALEVLEWNFKIYNRWGELIFESNDPEAAWDGSYISQFGRVPDGTYLYILDYISCEFPDVTQTITGHVNVLK